MILLLLRRILPVACIGVAGFSALAANSQIFENRNVQFALASSVANGLAKSKAAEKMLAVGAEPGPDQKIDLSRVDENAIRRLSLSGYAAEPLNVEAVRNLGLLAAAKGEDERAKQLMLDASSLSKRDLETNIWLVNYYGKNEDLSSMIEAFDNTLRTSRSARARLIPALFSVLDRAQLVQPVLEMLRKRPDWEIDFWRLAYSNPKALKNVVDLRIARGNDGYDPPQGYDARILEQLVRTGQFATAKRLHDYLRSGKMQRGIVQNPDFTQEPGLKPFSWDLQFDADLTAQLDPNAGRLSFTSYGGGAALVARQLIELPNGPLEFNATVGDKATTGDIRFRLRCAQGNGQATFDLGGIPMSPERFERPDRDCQYYWLEIALAPADRRAVRDAVLNSVDIREAASESKH